MAMTYSILPSEIDFQNYSFDFEEYVRNEVGLDITSAAKKNGETGDNICRFFLKGHCSKGNNCQFRHVRTDPSKAVVCKHWLRGLCKKGDNCEFLHEYNLRKMPECWFYSKYGECNNGTECIDSANMDQTADTSIPEKSSVKTMSQDGVPKDPIARTDIPNMNCLHPTGTMALEHGQYNNKTEIATRCQPQRMEGEVTTFRKVEDVTCFKCQQKGHYANRCPQGRMHDM
ncbi:Cleavage and polyadenylation specificity factor subunit 4 [Mortierella sp. AD031]|nr:Cleavage and polyadenylation specificity factor subunit 4 [Mortierella sp. AD031]